MLEQRPGWNVVAKLITMQRVDATDGRAPSGDSENQLIEWCNATAAIALLWL